jgi:F-type H+-transporting ATPase subunit delta
MSITEVEVQAQTVFDESHVHVARVYSNALINAATDQNILQLVVDEVQEVSAFFKSKPELLALFVENALGASESDALIQRAFSGQVHLLVLNLLRVLNEKSRIGLIHALADRLKSDTDNLLGRCRVFVQVARKLDERDLLKLEKQLQDRLNLIPQIEYSIDPSLIGGLVIRIGDLQFDSSIRSRLEQLRKNLLEGKIHEIQSRRDQLHTSA